jgi:putative copper export protein/mono/diheme cytochrome c family protein
VFALDLGAVSRAVHIAASLLPAGCAAFLVLLARSPAGNPAIARTLRQRLIPAMRWSLLVAFVSGATWLAAEAESMSGLPLRDALTPHMLATVLGSTVFGQLWLARAVILAALAVWLLRPRSVDDGVGADALTLLLSAVFAAALAGAGHAAGLEGGEGTALLTAQVVHLLATAGWLGALPGLVMVLRDARRKPASLPFAAAVTRRFSVLGIACVTALVLSGLVNSWFLVGTIPALFGTAYGRLLLLKLILFLAMLGLAAVNRLWLTPALDRTSVHALRTLTRTATTETVLGLLIVGIVGVLGGTPPGAHEQPLWPFAFTLSTTPIVWDGEIDQGALIAMAIGAVGLIIVALGAWRREAIVIGLGALAACGAGLSLANAMMVPAYPTSFMQSPAPFATASVVRGAPAYAEFCAGCHGRAGRGDGPAGAGLQPPPADLTAHLGDHSDGEIFWWISDGMEGSAMPGFAAQIPDLRRWDLVQFLRAQAGGAQSAALAPEVSPFVGFEAPDFTFQIDGGVAETLLEQRGRANVLLVFYTRAQSDDRLRQLAAARPTLYGTRIIAIPLRDAAEMPETAEFAAATDAETVAAYALYGVAAPHVEYLIDRSGHLRARWQLGQQDGWDDLDRLRTQLDAIEQQPFRRAEQPAHHH